MNMGVGKKLQNGLITPFNRQNLKKPGQCALFYRRLIVNKEDKRVDKSGKLG
jgi:hypothetical protein